MSIRREDTASKPNELQIGSPWIPVTPAKPGSTDRQPICTNWGETDRLTSADFVQENECQRAPACNTSTSLDNANRGINKCPADIPTNSLVCEENLIGNESVAANAQPSGKNSNTYKLSTNDSRQWTNMSFGNLLLAMTKKADMEGLTYDDFASSSASSSCLHPQFEGRSLEDPCTRTDFAATSSGNSFLQDQHTMIREDFDAEVRMENNVIDGSSITVRHFLDLNAPPRAITDAALRKSIHQFEPITPEKISRDECQQEHGMKQSSVDKAPTGEKNEITMHGAMQQHEMEKRSLLVDDQFCEVQSIQLQENHKPDKGGTEEAYLIKTPQQRTRRKKHRPKVIIEGQKKRTTPSAQKNNAPQDATRVKRKYVRKNIVTSPLGGGTNGIDSDNKTPKSTETQVGERKYRRKQRTDKFEDTDEESTDTAEIQAPQHTRRSCRRTLNFNTNDPVIDGVSSDFPSSNCERKLQENFNAKDQPETAHSTQETEVTTEKKAMISARVCTRSMNRSREDCLPRAEQHPLISLPLVNKDIQKETGMLTPETVCTRGKCQLVFSDVTHDKEANFVQVSMNPDVQRTPKSPSDSIGSGTCFASEDQIRGLKRQNTDRSVEAALCSRNKTGMTYNSMQAYLSVFTQNADNGQTGLHFPVIFKKKRTEKVYSITSSMQLKTQVNNGVKFESRTLGDSCKDMFKSPTNQGSYAAPNQGTNLLTTKDESCTQNGRQMFENLLAWGPTQRIKRRRSKGTRHRNLASLLESCQQWPKVTGTEATISRSKQKVEFLKEPPTCIEALAADTRSTIATKKRSKRSVLISSTVQNMYNHQNFADTSMGPPLALTWKSMSPVDLIVDKLNQLDLNADSRATKEKYNAFMRYHNYYEKHYALVPFQNSGAVVPFDQVRKRKPRPKVDLDDETTRVWRLLLENIDSEGIDGTNEENTKWWEEERKIFIGRADSFIARMHLVQGDRHFSPWKGSVVDSVVGVFLTQNVSDHLSSSAFMSLASRYPAKKTSHLADLHDEGLDGEINVPEICELDSDETFGLTKVILNETACGKNTKMLQDFEGDSIREMNREPQQNSSGDGSTLDGNLKHPSIVTSHVPVISCEIMANGSVSSNEDEKDTEETLSSETPEISSQNSANSPIAQTTAKSDSCLQSTSEERLVGVKPNWLTSSNSFVKLLQMTDTVLHGIYGEGNNKRKLEERQDAPLESLDCSLQKEDHLGDPTVPDRTIASCSQSSLCCVPNMGAQSDLELFQKNKKFLDNSSEKELCIAEISELSSESASGTTFQKSTSISCGVQNFPSSIASSSSNGQIEINQKKVGDRIDQAPAVNKMQGVSGKPTYQQSLLDATGSSSNIDNSKNFEHKEVNSNTNDVNNHHERKVNGPKSTRKIGKEKENPVDWDQLRKQAHIGGRKRERTNRTLDSADWDAIRCADVNEVAETIKERGMNNMLAERIKDFLNRIVRDHGSIDLEWLRDVPPDKAKEYLLSIRGLGLKSVECVRLLTLHHLAFPVDTNVGRIAVRLGWVPLQPLPESLQLHLLELYPVLESIQKYLWPRLCKLDQKTLYELHYQMITFGKVFCTKSKPNCNACPMRGECRHFASAYASARFALPAPQDKSIVSATENRKACQNPIQSIGTLQLPSSQTDQVGPKSGVSNYLPIIEEPQTPEPIIDVPATPEADHTAAEFDIENPFGGSDHRAAECGVESAFDEDPDEIPAIHLNMAEFTQNLQTIIQQNTELHEGEMSKALVALTSEAASIPVPKLKNVSQLRTEHQVYELPDSHQLLEGMDKREPDDPCPYLLAIWTPGETMDSIEPPAKRCSSQGFDKLCTAETCSSCNSIREAKSQTVRGTLLIPCRTAMRGSFPLNGTYFQVNEVFSDHESSLSPIDIPREWLWNLPRRTVYFGTSIPSIFKGLSTEGIQYCFWRGFVCVRGFDRKTRAPRPLIARLHFPASKLARGKGKIDENNK